MALVWNEQQRWHGFNAVQIEYKMFERVTVSLLGFDQLRRLRAMVGWQITQQAPEQLALFFLVSAEFSFSFVLLRGDHWGTARCDCHGCGALFEKVSASQ